MYNLSILQEKRRLFFIWANDGDQLSPKNVATVRGSDVLLDVIIKVDGEEGGVGSCVRTA